MRMRCISVKFSLPQYTELPWRVKQGCPRVNLPRLCVKTGTGKSLIKIARKECRKGKAHGSVRFPMDPSDP